MQSHRQGLRWLASVALAFVCGLAVFHAVAAEPKPDEKPPILGLGSNPYRDSSAPVGTPIFPPKTDTSPSTATDAITEKAAERLGMATIDVSRIYENHARYRSAVEKMKIDAKAAEDELKAECNRIQAIAIAAESLNGEEKVAKDREYAQRLADFNAKSAEQKKARLEREIRIDAAVYREICEDAAAYCKNHGIHLLLRTGKTRTTFESREEVMQTINRPVVFCDAPDITNLIIRPLNGESKPAADPTPPPVPKRKDDGK